jgi:hypothetical protein
MFHGRVWGDAVEWVILSDEVEVGNSSAKDG